jgi:predicted nucleic acid-binding Zn ribbon protein
MYRLDSGLRQHEHCAICVENWARNLWIGKKEEGIAEHGLEGSLVHRCRWQIPNMYVSIEAFVGLRRLGSPRNPNIWLKALEGGHHTGSYRCELILEKKAKRQRECRIEAQIQDEPG